MAEQKRMMQGVVIWLRSWFSLLKIPVSSMNAIAALFGYAAHSSVLSLHAAAMTINVLFLACGAAAINNVQDRGIDKRMVRTKKRPLPLRTVSSHHVLVTAGCLIASGTTGLWYSSSVQCALIGLSAVILYNCLYTPLKTRTNLALIPGVLCGMLPPMIGWLAAGGAPFSMHIWLIMMLFAIWQLPHFWLIILMNHDDYRASGLPTIRDILSETQLKRIIFVWGTAFSVLILFLVFSLMIKDKYLMVFLFINAISIPVVSAYLLFRSVGCEKYKYLFHYLNGSTLCISVFTIVDSLF